MGQGFAAGPVLVSYLGVVYQRGFFDDGVFDYSAVSPQCKYQDDMWFSAHLARKGIRRYVLGGALGVTELREMHLGPESLTYWDENKPRRVSEECNDSLLRVYADIWSWRRRLVLAVGGLPPFDLPSQAVGGKRGVTLGEVEGSRSLVKSGEWGRVFELLKRLPRGADLTYLCTKHSLTSRHISAAESTAGAKRDTSLTDNKNDVIGDSFWLDGVLVVVSDACEVYAPEPKVGHLLRDALRWEGDPDTVVVVGSVSDISASTGDVGPVADCAANLFRAEDDVTKHDRPQIELAGPAANVEPMPGSRLPVDDSPGEVIARTADASMPFCRMGGLASVSVGALSEMQRDGRM